MRAKAASAGTRNQQLEVLIFVDKGICLHCQAWMENGLLGLLRNWDVQYNRAFPTKLAVEVKGRNPERQVTKGKTDWDGISYSGSIRNLSKKELKKVKGDAW